MIPIGWEGMWCKLVPIFSKIFSVILFAGSLVITSAIDNSIDTSSHHIKRARKFPLFMHKTRHTISGNGGSSNLCGHCCTRSRQRLGAFDRHIPCIWQHYLIIMIHKAKWGRALHIYGRSLRTRQVRICKRETGSLCPCSCCHTFSCK